jgi:hypothetical protein
MKSHSQIVDKTQVAFLVMLQVIGLFLQALTLKVLYLQEPKPIKYPGIDIREIK